MSRSGPHRPERYPPPLGAGLLHPRHWPTWLGIGLLWLIGRLPNRWRSKAGEAIGRLVLRYNGKRRAIAAANLAWCFPELPAADRDRLVRGFAGYLGRSYLDFGEFWWSGRERFLDRVRFEGLERLEAALAAGERVILAVPHSLSMDIGGMALSARLPLATFANPMRNPVLEWVMASRRGRFGCTIHPRSHGIRPVLRELKEGRILFFPSDEDPGRRDAERCFAPFFGVQKATLTSPVRLARMVKGRLYPCSCHYDPASDRYVVTIDEPLPGVPGGDLTADTATLSAAFESAIRRAPEQYLWTQRLFQSRPDDAPPPYRMKHRPDSGPRELPDS